MAKIIVGTQGRINELLKGVSSGDIIDFHVNNDHAWVLIDSITEAAPLTEIIEKEVIKEVDNPEHLAKIKELKAQLDACQKENKKLKSKIAKLIEE